MDPTENLTYYDQEMQDCVESYCSFGLEQIEEAKKHCPDPQILIEQRLDFSAIEARVLSWLAGEQWRTDVFLDNGDIYCASASAMFGGPVEKCGQNAYLRQKGKIAELALGYGGSVGALKSMGGLPPMFPVPILWLHILIFPIITRHH